MIVKTWTKKVEARFNELVIKECNKTLGKEEHLELDYLQLRRQQINAPVSLEEFVCRKKSDERVQELIDKLNAAFSYPSATVDKEADAVYIYLTKRSAKSYKTKTLPCKNAIINVDYDENGSPLGLEIIGCKEILKGLK